MKQLISQLTMGLLSAVILLLTVTKESEGRRSPDRINIRSQQPVEKESPSSLAKTGQDSLTEDQSFMLLPLKDGILAGKSMYIWIY